MTLGQRLGGYVERGGLKQTAIAAEWLERWKDRGEAGQSWSDNTVQSQLSRLLNDQSQGVRFFFQDRVRGALLFQVLQVPVGDQDPMFALAESALRQEGAPARLLLDATGFSQSVTHAGALFAELKRLLVMEGPYPIDLLLLEEQYEQLPRNLDPFEKEKKLRLVQVKTAEQAWETVLARAEEQGTVLSARRFPVFERWLAADFDGQTLRIEPLEGVNWLRTRGALPPLEPVLHDLTEVVPPGEENAAGLKSYSARELHRWMRILRSEDESSRCKVDARTRQALALRLGITATSTARERLDAQVRALQQELGPELKIQPVSAEEFTALQARARRRELAPTALQVEDTVHLLNVPEAARLAQWRAWVQVHDLEPEPTALSRLLAEVDRWSEFDFLRDPFLEDVIAALDPEERERTAFLHARAGLLLNQALQPQTPRPEAQWQPLLAELLAGEPPEAELRVGFGHQTLRYAHRYRPVFLLPRSQGAAHEQLPVTPLRHVPPQGDVLVRRHDPGQLVTGNSWDPDDECPAVLIAQDEATARDPAFWLDAHDATMANQVRSTYARNPTAYLGKFNPWKTSELEVAPEYWELADRQLALVWLALREALVSPRAIRLPGGGVLLRLGGSFLAELRITRLARPTHASQVRGCLTLELDLSRLEYENSPGRYVMTNKAFTLTEFVATHTALGDHEFGARLPRRIHLLGREVCAELRFRGSALFSSAPLAGG